MAKNPPIMLNAIYDHESGEILIAHPTKENVFVHPSHFNKIISEAAKESHLKSSSGSEAAEKNCTYTQTEICTQYEPSHIPGEIGWFCTQVTKVQTCNCRD